MEAVDFVKMFAEYLHEHSDLNDPDNVAALKNLSLFLNYGWGDYKSDVIALLCDYEASFEAIKAVMVALEN